MTMPPTISVSEDDLAAALTTLSDLVNGFAHDNLLDDWRERAARLATSLREKRGYLDEGTWDVFFPKEPSQ